MTGKRPAPDALTPIDEALALLNARRIGPQPGEAIEPFRSLLGRCEALLERTADPEPVRLLHHFACTGGTVISRALSVMPNTVLLSEIDPLSTLMVRRDKPAFAPTDLIHGLRHSVRGIEEDIVEDIFLSGLVTLRDRLAATGQRLVLRDHPHSHYCTDRDPASRPSLRGLVARRLPVLSAVTVRHPLDSFLSLRKNGWDRHFSPATLDDYARRYLLFLEDHAGVPVVTYEAFVDQPDETLGTLCTLLDLPFSADAHALLDVSHLSGDSGRSGSTIARRARRDVPNDLVTEAAQSGHYADLCARLGYDPRPQAGS